VGLNWPTWNSTLSRSLLDVAQLPLPGRGRPAFRFGSDGRAGLGIGRWIGRADSQEVQQRQLSKAAQLIISMPIDLAESPRRPDHHKFTPARSPACAVCAALMQPDSQSGSTGRGTPGARQLRIRQETITSDRKSPPWSDAALVMNAGSAGCSNTEVEEAVQPLGELLLQRGRPGEVRQRRCFWLNRRRLHCALGLSTPRGHDDVDQMGHAIIRPGAGLEGKAEPRGYPAPPLIRREIVEFVRSEAGLQRFVHVGPCG
jgi:hypothetical protein